MSWSWRVELSWSSELELECGGLGVRGLCLEFVTAAFAAVFVFRISVEATRCDKGN